MTANHPAATRAATPEDAPVDAAANRKLKPLSPADLRGLVSNLRLLARLVPDLPLVITTPPRPSEGVRTVPGPKSPMALDAWTMNDHRSVPAKEMDAVSLYEDDRRAGERRYGLEPTLIYWASHVYEAAREDKALQGMTAPCGCFDTTINFLIRHAEFAATKVWGRRFHQSIGWMTAGVMRATGEERMPALYCREIDKVTKEPCLARVEEVPDEQNPDAPSEWWKCPRCNRKYHAGAEASLLLALQDPIPLAKLTPQLMKAFQVTSRTVETWASKVQPIDTRDRRHVVYGTVLVPEKTDAKGRHFYDMAASVKQVQAYRENTKTRQQRRSSVEEADAA